MLSSWEATSLLKTWICLSLLMGTGEMNLSWTKFRDKYLFTINGVLALGILLYFSRKDFRYHGYLAGWLAICLVFPKMAKLQEKGFIGFGKINSKIVLTLFYVMFFTPFSIFYKLFFKHSSFKTLPGQLVEKKIISDFDRPF